VNVTATASRTERFRRRLLFAFFVKRSSSVWELSIQDGWVQPD
jgi:hypothetical protein